jgi:hypothetical protein
MSIRNGNPLCGDKIWEGDKVKLTTARDCPLADCQQYLTDSYKTIANSQTVGEYGIFGLTLSTT